MTPALTGLTFESAKYSVNIEPNKYEYVFVYDPDLVTSTGQITLAKASSKLYIGEKFKGTDVDSVFFYYRVQGATTWVPLMRRGEVGQKPGNPEVFNGMTLGGNNWEFKFDVNYDNPEGYVETKTYYAYLIAETLTYVNFEGFGDLMLLGLEDVQGTLHTLEPINPTRPNINVSLTVQLESEDQEVDVSGRWTWTLNETQENNTYVFGATIPTTHIRDNPILDTVRIAVKTPVGTDTNVTRYVFTLSAEVEEEESTPGA